MSRSYPMTFSPRGWYQIACTSDIEKGAVLPLRYFGRELVVYRGEDGVARVLDAHCAHLGAHLGHGGRVAGDGIRCPFHGWCYGPDGVCREVAGSEKSPPRALVRPWPAREQDGIVYLFFSEKGEAPAQDPPRIPEQGSSGWTPWETHLFTIHAHVQEIAENIVDPAHFFSVHGTLTIPEQEFEAMGGVFQSRSTTRMQTPRGEVTARVDADGHGIGLWIVRFTGAVELLFLTSATPVDESSTHLRLSFSVNGSQGATNLKGVGRARIDDVLSQLQQDIVIWEHKIYRQDAVYGPFDRGLIAMRQWGRQFYA